MIPTIGVVGTAHVEQGNGREPSVAAELQPALLRALDSARIADHAIGDVVDVLNDSNAPD